MGKNLIVLGMSTLPLRKITREDGTSYCEVNANYCWWDGLDEEGREYYSQLEPISTMIKEKEKSLDKIIIFATSQTKNLFKFKCNGKDYEMSPVEFYLLRMGISNYQNVEILNIEDENFTQQMFEAVEIIRKFWNENIKANPKLWIDTQGGFRNMSLVINAIISLLKNDNIIPSGIYSVKYDRDNKGPKPIQDQTDTYKIFDFVSGINEFSRYGRAEQLEGYYKSVGEQKVPNVIKTMNEIAENIEMCDMIGFEKNLEKLRTFVKEWNNNNDLLNIFWSQIKKDYGKLLEDSCTGLDIVEWLYRKKFYQQAITYIEAKMPEEWVKREIISYNIDINTLEKMKEKLGKEYEKYDNIVISQIVYECFKWKSIMYVVEGNKIINNIKKRYKFKHARKDKYKDGFPNNEIDINIDDIEENKLFVNVDDNKFDDIMDMLLLYKLLKNERNDFNHMLEKNTKADKQTLGQAIQLFIEYGRKVY